MIRLSVLPLVAAAFAFASPSQAQDIAGNSASDSTPLRVAATAVPACVVGGASGRGSANAAFTPDGRGGGAIVISELVDVQSAQPRAARMELALPVICNSAHRMIIASNGGGLLRDGGSRSLDRGQGGFADDLPYTISYDWAGRTVSGSSARAVESTLQEAARGDLLVRIDTPAGGRALTAGRYTDTITIRIEPGN